MKVRVHVDLPHLALETSVTKLMSAFDLESSSHRHPDRPNRRYFHGECQMEPGDLFDRIGNTLSAFGLGFVPCSLHRYDSEDEPWDPNLKDILIKAALMEMPDKPASGSVH